MVNQLLTLAACALLAHAAPTLRKRALSNPGGAAPLVGLPQTEGQQWYYVGVPVSYERSPGSYLLLADTGSSYNYVDGRSCSDCTNATYTGTKRVLVNAQATLQVNGTSGCLEPSSCSYLDLLSPPFTDVWQNEAAWMQDTVTVGTTTPNHATQFGVVLGNDNNLIQGASGAVGLGPVAANDSSPFYNNLGDGTFTMGFVDNFAANTSESPGWLMFDSAQASSSWSPWVTSDTIQWTDVISDTYPAPYWTVNLTSLIYNGKSFDIPAEQVSLIDSGNPYFAIPNDAVSLFFADTEVKNGSFGLYWPCSSNAKLGQIDIAIQNTTGLHIDFTRLSVPYGGNDAPTDEPYCGGIYISNSFNTATGSVAFGLPALKSFVTSFCVQRDQVGFQQRASQ